MSAAVSGASPALKPNVEAIAAQMAAGRTFSLYRKHVNPTGPPTYTKESIFVFYRPGVRAGSFYWCAAALPAIPQDLSALPSFTLRDITDLFLDKQTEELTCPLAAGAPDAACCTIVSKQHTLNLECDSAQTRTFWVEGISAILSSAGKAVVKTGGDAAAPAPAAGAGGAAPQVPAAGVGLPASSPNAAARSGVAAPLSAGSGGFPPPLSAAEQQLVAALRAGHTFLLYGTSATIDVVLWYKADETKAGSLYYRSVGSNVDLRIPLHTITDVYIGKERMPPKLAEKAPEDVCFSIVSPTVSLHLQADTKETLETWLNGLHVVLTSKGKRVAVDTDTTGTSKPPGGSLTGLTASSPAHHTIAVAGGSQRGALPPLPLATGSGQGQGGSPRIPGLPAAGAGAGAGYPGAGGVAGPSPRAGGLLGAVASPSSAAMDTAWQEKAMSRGINVRMMLDGSPFWMYTGPGRREAVTLCYKRDETSAGSLYWKASMPQQNGAAPGAGAGSAMEYDVSRRQPLHKITDVFMGKEVTPPPPAPAAPGAAPKPPPAPVQAYFFDTSSESQCMSIMNLDRRCLQLEAPSADVLDAWLNGINYLLTNSGRRVVEDASPSPNAAAAAAASGSSAGAAAAGGGGLDSYAGTILQLSSAVAQVAKEYDRALDKLNSDFADARRLIDERQRALTSALSQARDAKVLALQTQLKTLEAASAAKDPVSKHNLKPAASAQFASTVSMPALATLVGGWRVS